LSTSASLEEIRLRITQLTRKVEKTRIELNSARACIINLQNNPPDCQQRATAQKDADRLEEELPRVEQELAAAHAELAAAAPEPAAAEEEPETAE
jgi:chromosome segregation ATPase